MPRKDVFYFSSLLRNGVLMSLNSKAKQTHTQILVNGFLPNITLETGLLLAYRKCGLLQYGHHVFDRMPDRNIHAWNILIASYVQNSLFPNAFRVFCELMKIGTRPDHYTFPPVFKACAGKGVAYVGKVLHGWVVKLGFEEYLVVGSSILDFYVKCGNLTDARQIFLNMSWRDSIVWNSMITGFGRGGFYVQALNCFRHMLGEGVKMDPMAIPSILNACGGEGDLIRGKEVHGQVVKALIVDEDVAVGNSLINMYAKCGCLHYSEKVFRIMPNLNLVTWTTMISCYGIHGKGEKSLILFDKMKNYGFRPNCVTLTTLLASCSHSGLIDQGRQIFNSISLDSGFEPCVEHYACMVDLLGRFGYLDEALGLVKNMKLEAIASVWGALLAGCMMHKNVKIGEIAAQKLFELEPRNSSNYIAMCSIYESLCMQDDNALIRGKMRKLGLVKAPGCSWITIAGTIHKFYQGDNSHPLAQMIYETLNGILKGPILLDSFIRGNSP